VNGKQKSNADTSLRPLLSCWEILDVKGESPDHLRVQNPKPPLRRKLDLQRNL
jgi:hypothetical protein